MDAKAINAHFFFLLDFFLKNLIIKKSTHLKHHYKKSAHSLDKCLGIEGGFYNFPI